MYLTHRLPSGLFKSMYPFSARPQIKLCEYSALFSSCMVDLEMY